MEATAKGPIEGLNKWMEEDIQVKNGHINKQLDIMKSMAETIASQRERIANYEQTVIALYEQINAMTKKDGSPQLTV